MKSRHERAALFGFFRNCSETLISSDVNREGYAYRAIESAKITGLDNGRTILKKMVYSPAPSIFADSIGVCGISTEGGKRGTGDGIL